MADFESFLKNRDWRDAAPLHDADSEQLPEGGTTRFANIKAPETYNSAKGTPAELMGGK